MKKIRIDMDKWFEKLDEHWRTLPLRRQRKYTLYFFVGYLLLTTGVLFKIFYDAIKSNNDIAIEHIENPILKKKGSSVFLKDTSSIILKNKIYERK
jgi:hypothetical protein